MAELFERLFASVASHSTADAVTAVLDVLFAAAPMGIAVLDQELRLVFANAAFANANDGSIASLLTAPNGDIALATMAASVRERGTPRTATWQDWSLHLFPIVFAEHGVGVGCVLEATPIPSDDRAVAVHASFDDQILATVTHELRTPIAAMLLWDQAMRQHPGDPAVQTRGLNAIRAAAREEARLLDDLAELSQWRRGKARLDLAPVELNAEIEVAMAELAAASNLRGVTLNAQCATGIGPIEGDRQRLRRVLIIVLRTALEASPSNCTLVISVQRRSDAVEIATGELATASIAPRDSELRMEEARGRQPLPRLDVSWALARAIVEAHGGTICAANSGSARFAVTLPAPRL